MGAKHAGWVVQSKSLVSDYYLKIAATHRYYSWTSDIEQALRFYRKRDADSVIGTCDNHSKSLSAVKYY